MLPVIAIAEHDPAAACVLEMTLRQRVQCTVKTAKYGYELMELLTKHPDIQLVVIDVRLPDMSGMELMNQLNYSYPALPVVMASSARDEALVKFALEQGAVDYIRKTDPPARIAALIKSVLAGEVTKKAAPVKQGVVVPAHEPFSEFIGTSSAMQKVVTSARQAALSDIPVILKGESGVGKERFARAIHQASARAKMPFVAVNCGAIPANLVESTLFGHTKGAFTGATSISEGKFREAHGGTLLLDEIGELPLEIQVKLLRAIQEREVQPVGAGKPVPVDIRIISATHVNLEQAIAEGRFREDLYYRLHVFPIEIPPLRMRGREDIEVLSRYFMKRFTEQEGKRIEKIGDAAMALLTSYSWPGNIRQLENAIYRAVVISQSDMLRVEDVVMTSNALQQRLWVQQKEDTSSQVTISSAFKPEKRQTIALLNEQDEFRSLEDLEAEILLKALSYYRWHITKIAKVLGLTRATVYKKMKQAGIEDPREQSVAEV